MKHDASVFVDICWNISAASDFCRTTQDSSSKCEVFSHGGGGVLTHLWHVPLATNYIMIMDEYILYYIGYLFTQIVNNL